MTATTAATGCRVMSSAATATSGTTWATMVSVHERAYRERRAGVIGARQETDARSGRAAALTRQHRPGGPDPRGSRRGAARAGSTARDRLAEDHQVGVERQLADLLRVPLALRDDRVIPLLERAAERNLGVRGVLRRRPLRQRRVPRLVHAYEPCHGPSVRPTWSRSLLFSRCMDRGR